MPNNLSDLPQIQSLLDQPLIGELAGRYTHAETKDALRIVIGKLRAALLAQDPYDLPDFESPAFAATVAEEIEAARAPSLRSVINATGILIHTNLGRSQLAPQAIRVVAWRQCVLRSAGCRVGATHNEARELNDKILNQQRRIFLIGASIKTCYSH